MIFGGIVELPGEFYSGKHINLSALVDELHVGRTMLSTMKSSFLKMHERLKRNLLENGFSSEDIVEDLKVKSLEWSEMPWRDAKRFAETGEAKGGVNYDHEAEVKAFSDRFVRAFGKDIIRTKGHVIADAFLGLSRVNLSRAAEEALRVAVRQARADRWRAENAEALASSNAWVEQHGLPLARYQAF